MHIILITQKNKQKLHGIPRKLNRLECLLPPFFACMRFGFLNFFVKEANRLYAFHLFTSSPLSYTFTKYNFKT